MKFMLTEGPERLADLKSQGLVVICDQDQSYCESGHRQYSPDFLFCETRCSCNSQGTFAMRSSVAEVAIVVSRSVGLVFEK